MRGATSDARVMVFSGGGPPCDDDGKGDGRYRVSLHRDDRGSCVNTREGRRGVGADRGDRRADRRERSDATRGSGRTRGKRTCAALPMTTTQSPLSTALTRPCIHPDPCAIIGARACVRWSAARRDVFSDVDANGLQSRCGVFGRRTRWGKTQRFRARLDSQRSYRKR